ncbi:MAG: hypothetical protein ACP5GA_08630, partial [Acidithiobacillus sp.]
ELAEVSAIDRPSKLRYRTLFLHYGGKRVEEALESVSRKKPVIPAPVPRVAFPLAGVKAARSEVIASVTLSPDAFR